MSGHQKEDAVYEVLRVSTGRVFTSFVKMTFVEFTDSDGIFDNKVSLENSEVFQ